MLRRRAARTEEAIGFEAWGVPIAITAPTELRDRLELVLPPERVSCDPEVADHRFAVSGREDGRFDIRAGERRLLGYGAELEIAIGVLDSEIRSTVAQHATDVIFIHAGVVTHGERAIVIPGTSFSGKTSLVVALVRAGARYYSDEFAVIDPAGLVHAYPKPLSIRAPGERFGVDHAAEALGGTEGGPPVRAGLIVVTHYSAEARWEPTELRPGEGALALLANAVTARKRPGEVLTAARAAAEGARVLQGERGEAAEVASELLAVMDAAEPAEPRSG